MSSETVTATSRQVATRQVNTEHVKQPHMKGASIEIVPYYSCHAHRNTTNSSGRGLGNAVQCRPLLINFVKPSEITLYEVILSELNQQIAEYKITTSTSTEYTKRTINR